MTHYVPIGFVAAAFVGMPQTIHTKTQIVTTSIFKRPRSVLRINNRQLVGDGQADAFCHGGKDRAVYIYLAKDYQYWNSQISKSFEFGSFGENLVISNVRADDIGIDTTLRVGNTLLEVKMPRLPCHKLGIRTKSKGFPKTFLNSGRLGFFASVIEGKSIHVGTQVDIVQTPEQTISPIELWRMVYSPGQATISPEYARDSLRSLDDDWKRLLDGAIRRR